MDSFEINKIVGAILGTLILVMGVGFLAEAIYEPIQDRGVGYALPEPEAGAGAVEVVEVVTPLPVLLASASAERGAAVARKCQSCHNFEEGAGSKAGPPLYDIVNAEYAHIADYSYSDVIAERGAAGEIWTYENLNAFLTSPKAFTPGTKMTFAGLRKPEERADMLAYLQTLSGSPVAFPEVVEVPAEAMGEDSMGESADEMMEDDAEMAEDMAEEATEEMMSEAEGAMEEAAHSADTMAEEMTDAVEEMVDPEMDINSAVESGAMALPTDAPAVPAAQ